jgi:hypothetical protein
VKDEILPAKWVYLTFVGEDLGHMEEVKVWQGDDVPPKLTMKGKTLWLGWVIFGTPANARAKAQEVWLKKKGSKDWRLEDIHYYPQNYKRQARECIRRGEFTP